MMYIGHPIAFASMAPFTVEKIGTTTISITTMKQQEGKTAIKREGEGKILHTSDPFWDIPTSVQKRLLKTSFLYKKNFSIKDTYNTFSGQQIKSRFLKKGVIWFITKDPGLLDMPIASKGVHDGRLVALKDMRSVIDFYNNEEISFGKKDQVALAQEILEVAYHKDEFGYANNTNKPRGYFIVASSSDITGLVVDDTNKWAISQIAKPTTKRKTIFKTLPTNPNAEVRRITNINQEVEETTMWFWGAHNGELHKLVIQAQDSKKYSITNYSDEVLGKLGKTSPLTYE